MQNTKRLLRLILSGAILLLAGALVGGLFDPLPSVAERSSPAALPTWGVDIQINPTTTATPDVQHNYSLALDPTNPNHVIASYDSTEAPLSNSGYAWSLDAGRTWQGGRLYGPWISDTVPSGNTSVGFDSSGTAYYASLGVGANYQGYFVLTSTVGSSWGTARPVVLSDNTDLRRHAHLAVDPRPAGPFAGSLYMVWDYYNAGNQGAWLRYSRDQGRTWSADVPVSDVGHEDTESPAIVPAANGTVYVAFAFEDAGERFLYLDRTLDGGATWGTDQLITGAPITPVGALDEKRRDLVLIGSADGQPFEIPNVPFIAVSPTNAQTIYAVWNDGRWDADLVTPWNSTGKHSDIAFSRSTNGGATWSAPQRINDDVAGTGIDQFMPTIAVGPNGLIGVTWHDRRDNPTGYLYHLYYSQSSDGGQTWTPNQRISDVASSPVATTQGKGVGLVGEYSGLIYGPNYVLPSWEDTRGGPVQVQDLYTDRGTLDLPNPGPCMLSFVDVPTTHPFYPYVQGLACQGIISGYGCGGPGEPCPGSYFRVTSNTTRGQVMKIITLALGWTIQPQPAPTFADVPASHPFYSYIETAYTHGVISGYGCGGPGEPCPGLYFRPSALVTRGQICKITVNAKGWGPLTPVTPTFSDVPPSDPFYSYIERAYAKGVVVGYSCGGAGEPCPGLYFRATTNATRGQLSKILYNAYIQP